MSRETGMKAEYFFISKLNEKGLPYEYEDDYFDFLVDGVKVEVKSASLVVKEPRRTKKGRVSGWRFGRFDFTSQDNRTKLREEKVWVALVARGNADFMLLGFQKAHMLPDKRYLHINQYRNWQLIDIDKWILEIAKARRMK